MGVQLESCSCHGIYWKAQVLFSLDEIPQSWNGLSWAGTVPPFVVGLDRNDIFDRNV